MTVYIPDNKGKYDISRVYRYGQVEAVFTKNLFPDDIDDNIQPYTEHAVQVLSKFDCDRDYLCLIGAPMYLCICMQVLTVFTPRVRLLRFDRLEGLYYVVHLPSVADTMSWVQRYRGAKHAKEDGQKQGDPKIWKD